VSVEICGVRVSPGDLVCADADGAAIIAAEDAEQVRAAVEALERRERAILSELGRGASTVELYGLAGLA